jgi:DnaJ-domain-containing protein 1
LISTEQYNVLLPLLIFNLPFIIVYFSIPGRKRITYNSNDKDIFIIAYNFLKCLEFTEDEILNKLKIIFRTHPLKQTLKLYVDVKSDQTPIYGSCKNLKSQPANIRFYVLYTILDLASEDNLLTIDEDDYINEIRDLLRIPKETFRYILNSYFKKGLQEERKLFEEENRKKLAESFVPYNAYKVLGITPNITKDQLKKVYRKLAKKYHPDKYYGQSDAIIQEAEEKFQEITKAYEIILNHMKN